MTRIKLVQTCGGCPEQYNVFIDGEEVRSGFLYLRHGCFHAEYNGEVVFSGHPRGDGIFEFDERNTWLNRACKAILERHDAVNEKDEDLLFELFYTG